MFLFLIFAITSGLYAINQTDPPEEPKEVTIAFITLVGTIITAVGSFAAAVISAYIANREKTRANKLEEGSLTVGKSLEKQLLDRYGFQAKSSLTRVEILNANGDSVITRIWEGIEIAQDVTLTAIPTKYKVDSPQGKLLWPPTFEAKSSDGGNFPKGITLVGLETSEKSCRYALEITGALTRHDPALNLTTRLETKASYLMTYEEFSAAYPNSQFKGEYHAFAVDIPTKFLELEIRFPPGFKAKTFPGVFFGAETIHSSELKRVRGGFTELESGARLRVEDPLLGFSYLIYWVPPRQAS